jgi:kanamycin kinase
MSLHAVLRAAALLVPTVVEVRHAVGHAITIWRIWPLWQNLVDAVPHVALSATRSRVLVLLQPHLPLRLIVYRTVIEIRAAILTLSHYADPAVFRSARAHVARRGVPADHTDAHVTACVLRLARAAKLADAQQPDPAAVVLTTNQDTGDLAAETASLLQLTEAYFSPCVRDFGESADDTPTPAGGPQ